jgi:DNA-binding PadR family transcriptional regulator
MDAGQARPMARLRNMLAGGNLWLYILSLMRRRKKVYAYELPERIEGEFSFRPNRVMIYVVLYKLEEERLIGSQFEERRKYYHLTAYGRKVLGKAKGYLALLAKRL